MTTWPFVAAGLALAGLVGVGLLRRSRHYARLSAALSRTLDAGQARMPELPAHPVPDFSKRIAAVPHFLPDVQLESLRAEVEGLVAIERSYLPTHKKGGTVAYENLIERAPNVLRLYHSAALRQFISRTVGTDVRPTPLFDQNSISILVYDRPGDHIDWHFDYNFYRGRHFTVLLAIVNVGQGSDGLSHARLSAKLDGVETGVATPPGTLVVFEGTKVLHKASPIKAGERRILMSMTFCSDSRSSWLQAIARRIKDTAFFGVRALWT